MSLAVLNEDRDLGEKYNAADEEGAGARSGSASPQPGASARAATGVDARTENEVLADLYTALGNLAPPGRQAAGPGDVVQQALADAGAADLAR